MLKILASRRISTFVLALLALSGASPAAAEPQKKPLALVYQGPGGCSRWKCHEAAAAAAHRAGFDIKFVTPARLTEEIFEGASLWVQPGGNAITVAKKIGPEGLALIRKFVKNGGAYVGFCAGAFLADKTVDDEETVKGLGIIPMSTFDYPVDSKEDGIPLEILWKTEKRTLFFNGGGSFKTKGKDRTPEYTVFAWYPNGDAASLETAYGKGGVVVTGAHPEALEQWKKDAKFEDPDGSDVHLAQEMVVRAIQLSIPSDGWRASVVRAFRKRGVRGYR